MSRLSIFVLTVFIPGFFACNKAVEIETNTVQFNIPANFPAPHYNFANNPVTKAGFELGRKLFYDPQLSRDNTISCGSCHIQTAGFTHHGHDVSHGIDDRLGSRNAPPIFNMAWSSSFMWDGGVFNLDLFSIAPITNPVEMDESMPNVLKKLQASNTYPNLYKDAFGTAEITTARTLKALSQFMNMLISKDATYDKVMRNEGVQFNASEQAGYIIFKGNCATCHQEPLFTDNSFRNNGIGVGPNNDTGREAISLQPADRYTFKVPSLRNLQYTKPFMHDGRFLNLEGVIEHYSTGVSPGLNIDSALYKSGRWGFHFTEKEKKDLLAFLQTLNDKNFVTNPLFSE